MTTVRRYLVLFPLTALVLALPGRALAGDEAPAADDRTRAVAAALENENLRMRALIESAALLAKAGRQDEAIAALRGVENVRSEGKALLERLLASKPAWIIVREGSSRPPTPPPPDVGWPRPPEPKDGTPPKPRWYPPDRTGPDPDGALSRLPHLPTVAAGVGGLLAARGADRLWRSASAGDGPADLGTTGLAILALLDASDPAQEAASADELSTWSDAAKQSLKALGALHDGPSGRFLPDADPEAHAIATWALAAGLTRFSDPSWRAPLKAAVARALADRNAKGLWPSASGTPDDDWVLAGFEVAMLHEAAIHGPVVDGLGVAEAIDRAGALAFADQIAATPLTGAAAAYARACLARRTRRGLGLADGPFLPTDAPKVVFEVPRVAGGALDATGLLFATTLRVGGDGADLQKWQRRVLTAVFAEGEAEPRAPRTWAGGDARSLRHGPAYSSACVLLSWLAPTSQLRFPKSP